MEEAKEELRADGIEAAEAMIEALGDEDARELIKIGMLLAHNLWIEGGQQVNAERDGADTDNVKSGTSEAGVNLQLRLFPAVRFSASKNSMGNSTWSAGS